MIQPRYLTLAVTALRERAASLRKAARDATDLHFRDFFAASADEADRAATQLQEELLKL